MVKEGDRYMEYGFEWIVRKKHETLPDHHWVEAVNKKDNTGLWASHDSNIAQKVREHNREAHASRQGTDHNYFLLFGFGLLTFSNQ